MRNSGGGSMLSFEVILKTYEVILLQDPLYEVVSTSHSYTLLHGSHAESSGTVRRFWKHRKSYWKTHACLCQLY